MQCDTREEISDEMTSLLFKGDCAQITVGVNKMDCDSYEERWDEMKIMLFEVSFKKDLHWREQDELRHVRGDIERDEERCSRLMEGRFGLA